jgi:hypothetical protein
MAAVDMKKRTCKAARFTARRLTAATPKIGGFRPDFGPLGLDKVFSSVCYHRRIVTYLDYNPFPGQLFSAIETRVRFPSPAPISDCLIKKRNIKVLHVPQSDFE